MNSLLNILFIFLLVIVSEVTINAQISPGKLSKAHSHLEGISNCTECHDLGNKVPDEKCLSCHKEIQFLISADRGFHVSTEVINNDCIKCHSDHHGLNFDMTRFDEEAFDHRLTGYDLEGTHAIAECKSCHSADNIKDTEIKNRPETFLGLVEDCISCHSDYHQKSLGTDCASCHDINTFRPAPFFDHDKSEFSLAGAHQNLECIKCHPITSKNNVEYQEFSDIEYQACTSCHQDEHKGNLPGKCNHCHKESSFKDFVGARKFNHNLTNFQLKGKHKNTACFECHSRESNPLTLFQDQQGINENNCVSCHEDTHEGKFGNDCYKCHTEETFIGLKETAEFNHSLTDFPLEGKHNEVDCKSCHVNDFLSPLEFGKCFECHEDFHEGVFVIENTASDCKDCHSVDEQFSYTTYGIEQHNTTEFVLEGAHLATPCFACHINEDEKWHFENLGKNCIDCHENIHKETLSQKILPDSDCTICHSTIDWKTTTFDHKLTAWPLIGAHENVDCKSCHLNEQEKKIIFNNYSSAISLECSQCHNDIHNNQFTIEGKSNCSECHNPENWDPIGFNHNNSSFPLDGVHAETECIECHKIMGNEAGLQYSQYKIAKHECIDCHS